MTLGTAHGHKKQQTTTKEIELTRLPGFETDALTDMLIQYLEEVNNPFFAVLSVQPPHNPYAAPAEWMERHNPTTLTLRPNVPQIPRIQEQARRELAGYYALIENLDWNLGRIQAALEKTGLAETTRIMFFSDHGDMHGSQGQFRKTSPFQEAISVPFIVGKPTNYNPYQDAQIVHTPINHVDFAPTSLGLCGIPVPEGMEGTDYSSLIIPAKDRSVQRKVDFPGSVYLQSVIPPGHGNSVDKAWRGIVTDDGWKYVCFEGIDWLMFNLQEDPYEQANLVHNPRFKETRARLRSETAAWVQKTGDTFIIPGVGE